MANDKDFKVKNGLDVGSTVTLQAYGQGNNIGNAAKILAVDSSGNLIEEAPSAGGGLANVVEDETPQLGGNLDVNGNSIVSVSGGDIAITPDGDGQIVLDGLNWPISDGTDRQVLVTDGSGELTFDDIPPVQVAATNNTGSSIAAGTPVYQTGVSGQNITIAPADASSASTMPAIGVTKGAISASGGTGVVVVSGFLKGINTSTYTAGDTLYVANGGGFTTSLSNLTGEGNLIENLGKVVKSDASAGSIIVTGAGRANATPNLNDGNFFLGNSSNQAGIANFAEQVDDRVNTLVTDGTGITTSYDDIANTLTISHFDTSSASSLDALTGADVVSDIDLDSFGHVTAMSTRTMTLNDLGYTGETDADNYASWSISDGTNTEAIGSGHTLTFAGSGASSVSYNAASNTLTVSSNDIFAGTGIKYSGTTLNLDFSELTDMTGNISGTTEFILQDGTLESRKAAGEISLSAFDNSTSGFTTNTGTVTSVSGGSGLSGTVTSSGSLEVDLTDTDTFTSTNTASKAVVRDGSGNFAAGTITANLTGDVTGTVSSLSNHDTDDLAEGSNLYYTSTRFDNAFSGKSTDNLSEGSTNLYYTDTRANTAFDNRLATKTTTNLAEGTNLYHTTERVEDAVANQFVTVGQHTGISFAYDDANDGAIDATVSLGSFNTDNLSEGSSNLYFTDERVDDRVDALITDGTGVTSNYDDAAGTLTLSIGQDVATTSSVTFAGVTAPLTGNVTGDVTGDVTSLGTSTFATVDINGGAIDGTVIGGNTAAAITGTTVTDSKGDVRDIPQTTKTAAYPLVIGDAGTHISITTGGITVNGNVFQTGDAVTIYNDSGSNQTITQGTNCTLRLAGTATTGDLTLAQYGVCTILCVKDVTNADVFVVSGGGIS